MCFTAIVSQCFSLVSPLGAQEDRPTAVEVLEQMTAAMKAEMSESVPVYWRNAGATGGAGATGSHLTDLTCEVGREETAEWQNGRTTFRQLQAALMETVHEKCGSGTCLMP